MDKRLRNRVDLARLLRLERIYRTARLLDSTEQVAGVQSNRWKEHNNISADLHLI